MEKQYDISVILPVYNNVQYLEGERPYPVQRKEPGRTLLHL